MIGSAALTAILLPQTVAAKGSECRTVAALVSFTPSERARIAIAINRQGTLDVTYRGKADLVKGASDCEVNAPSDYLELECHWDIDDEAAARAKMNVLRAEIGRCLGMPLVARERGAGSGSLEVLERFGAEVERPEKFGPVDVEVQLFSWSDVIPGGYWVVVNFRE